MPIFSRGLGMEGCVILTKKEAEAVFEWAEAATGCSPENTFAWDGSDSLDDPSTSAAYKIFKACGRNVPENLENGDSEKA